MFFGKSAVLRYCWDSAEQPLKCIYCLIKMAGSFKLCISPHYTMLESVYSLLESVYSLLKYMYSLSEFVGIWGFRWYLWIPFISVDYCCCFFEITERFVKKGHLLRLKTFVDNSKSRSTSKKRVWYYSLFHWDCWRMKLFLKGKGFIRYVDSINLWWNSVTSYN